MKVRNFSNGEITLKNSLKTGAVLGVCCGIAKGADDFHKQYQALNHYQKTLDNFTQQKECASELTNQFLDKCPKISKKILGHFDQKINNLKSIHIAEHFDFKNTFKSCAKTAAISAVIIGGIYFIAKTLKNILETNND